MLGPWFYHPLRLQRELDGCTQKTVEFRGAESNPFKLMGLNLNSKQNARLAVAVPYFHSKPVHKKRHSGGSSITS